MINKLRNFFFKNFYSPEKYARHIGVKIGANCLISTRGFSSEPYLIEIGDNVRIANDVKFFTHGGLIPFRDKLPKKMDMFGKIKIGNNVHIGDSAMILPGVEIGDNCLIGAGSVISKSISSNSVAVGNPAIIVSTLDRFLNNATKANVGSKGMNYQSKKKYLLSLSDDKFIRKKYLQ